MVEDGLKRLAPGQNCILDVQKEHLVIFHAERVTLDLGGFGFAIRSLAVRSSDHIKIMRFTLMDEQARTFRGQRWCFRGSIDRWIDLGGSKSGRKLKDLVEKSCPHIGRESFFNLF